MTYAIRIDPPNGYGESVTVADMAGVNRELVSNLPRALSSAVSYGAPVMIEIRQLDSYPDGTPAYVPGAD